MKDQKKIIKALETFHDTKTEPEHQPIFKGIDNSKCDPNSFIFIDGVWGVKSQIEDVIRNWPRNVDKCYTDPKLPNGLILNSNAGIIGKPTESSPTTKYTLSAEYKGKVVYTTKFVLRVMPPLDPKMPNTSEIGLKWTVEKGKRLDIINITHLLEGERLDNPNIIRLRGHNFNSDWYALITHWFGRNHNPDWYAIYPAYIGNGMSFDPRTGTIFGTPEKANGLTKYTIESCVKGDYPNKTKYRTRSLDIEIVVVEKGDHNLDSRFSLFSTVIAIRGEGISPIRLVPTGKQTKKFIDKADYFMISPEPKGGLIFDKKEGVLSGNPTEVCEAVVYTITAGYDNDGGTFSQKTKITVQEDPSH